MAGITVARDGHVGVVTIDRPEVRNALDLAARAELADAFAALDTDPEIRVAVITGAGGVFCAGTDLSVPPDPSHPLSVSPQRLTQPVDDFSKPLIAAVDGGAAGGGFELALAAEIRVASTTAKFLLPELRIGSLPGSGGTQRIFAALPSSIAWELLLTGRAMDASTAVRYGLVSAVHETSALMAAALAIAYRIAEAAPLSLTSAKRAGRRAIEGLGAGLTFERELWTKLADSYDRAEGRAAFRDKRPPRFEGR